MARGKNKSPYIPKHHPEVRDEHLETAEPPEYKRWMKEQIKRAELEWQGKPVRLTEEAAPARYSAQPKDYEDELLGIKEKDKE